MAKKTKVARKRATRKKTTRPPFVNSDVGPLDAALYVTYASEAALGLVEYSHAPSTQVIQEFAVHVQDVSARSRNAGWERDMAREIFHIHDQRDMPYFRVIGRCLDELLNHRGFSTCSGGDVYFLLLDELWQQLPDNHQQRERARVGMPFNRTLNPGRRTIDNRLRDLKGASREDGKGAGPTYVATTSTTQGGAEQGYRLTEVGSWLFDGWPELSELVRRRTQPPR